MFARVASATLLGVDAIRIDVEVDVTKGQLPSYHVVGLPAASVKEGAMRMRSALGHVGQKMPSRRITVNLAPADERKHGAAFDLPIAIAVLCADQSSRLHWPADLMVMGELGLDGEVRTVPGALSAALLARELGFRGIVLPSQSAASAVAVTGIEVFVTDHLSQVIAFLAGQQDLARAQPVKVLSSLSKPRGGVPSNRADMSDVRGQELARFGVEVAVAGGHNLLFLGPPGAGKTMLARCVPSLLPALSTEEALETTKVYAAVGQTNGQLMIERPFRAPHHTSSAAALVGGGIQPRPGEISLAHHGVLFLDELAEFSRTTLETLRQPLESRHITIGRAHSTVKFPASFLLIAAANPCPCGWHGSSQRECVCAPRAISNYRRRLSGPLLDRIDLQVRVRSLNLIELRSQRPSESSAAIRERVVRARAIQKKRLREYGISTNAEMTAAALRTTCRLTAAGEATLAKLQAVRGFTARGLQRIIKVARSVADLEGRPDIAVDDIIDAANLRALESDQKANRGSRKSLRRFDQAAPRAQASPYEA